MNTETATAAAAPTAAPNSNIQYKIIENNPEKI